MVRHWLQGVGGQGEFLPPPIKKSRAEDDFENISLLVSQGPGAWGVGGISMQFGLKIVAKFVFCLTNCFSK